MNNEIHKELVEIAPKLSEIPKQDLEAPEAYFDTFSSRLLDRIHTENIKQDAKVVRFWNYKKYIVAASIFVFLGISIYLVKFQEKHAESATLEELYLSEIDESSIIEYTNNTQTTATNNDVEVYQHYLDEASIIEEL